MTRAATVRNCFVAIVAAMGCTAPHASLIYGNGRLEADVLGASCTTMSPDGITTSVPCDPAGWSPTLEPGWSALMTATIGYSYADDGLRFDHPRQIQVNTRSFVDAPFEFAVLYAETSNSDCARFSGNADHCDGLSVPYDAYFGQYHFPPLFISNNDHAEDVSGQITVTTGWKWDPPSAFYGQGYTLTPNLFVSTYGFADAVPEPSTWALMLGSLAVLGWRVRRRLVPTPQ
jgi:hypothetical protein